MECATMKFAVTVPTSMIMLVVSNALANVKKLDKLQKKIEADRLRLRTHGSAARAKLIEEASMLKKEIEDNINDHKIIIHGIEEMVKKKTAQLKEMELREKSEAVKKPKPDSKISVVVQSAKDKFQEYQTALGMLKEERDSAKQSLKTLETILTTFKSEYNPNFNDEGVKRAVRAWEEYMGKQLEKQEKGSETEQSLDNLITNTPDVNWDDLSIEEAAAESFHFDKYLPMSARVWIHTKMDIINRWLVDNGILAPRSHVGDSNAVRIARESLEVSENELKEKTEHLEQLKKEFKTSYGPDDAFRPLKNTCISRESGEYRYEYCFFGRASQISRKDNNNVSLGDFTRLEHKDQSSLKEAAGIFSSGWKESHEEALTGVVLRHENGQQCWNGPQRSVNVELYCNGQNEIRKVVEMEKCVYQFEVGTPAVCHEVKLKSEENLKTEL